MTQEEINKATKIYVNGSYIDEWAKGPLKAGFKAGVKFAQSKMYSEEEIKELIKRLFNKYSAFDALQALEYFETVKKT